MNRTRSRAAIRPTSACPSSVCGPPPLTGSAFGETLFALGFAKAGGLGDEPGLGLAIGNAEVTLVELVAAYRDAWTVAWNPQYVVGVWCGHKFGGFGDKTLVGAKAAAPVAWRIARALYPGNDGPWFVEPGEVVHRRVCALTGLPASGDCPRTEEGRALAGRSGTTPCPVHVRDVNGNVIERTEALASAYAGTSEATGTLAISKPENDAVFCLAQGMESQTVVCQVVGNPGDAQLWWFADGRAVGESSGVRPSRARARRTCPHLRDDRRHHLVRAHQDTVNG